MRPQYINFFSVFIFTFFLSAFLGRKNPILTAIGSILLIGVIGYSLNEISLSLIYYWALGFVSCLLWSMFFRWLTLKGRMGENDTKLKLIMGFRTRNTTIISEKNSKSPD